MNREVGYFYRNSVCRNDFDVKIWPKYKKDIYIFVRVLIQRRITFLYVTESAIFKIKPKK